MSEFLSPLRLKRKNNLLETAEDYFIEHGLHNSTMEDIAAASGISRQTVYRYYSSKEDLAFAVEIRVLSRLFGRMEELFSAADGMRLQDLYELTDDLITRFVSEYERELKFTGVFDAYFQNYPDDHYYEQMRKILGGFSNPFTEIIEKERRKGNLTGLEVPSSLIGETISNSILSLCQRVLLRRQALRTEYGTDPIVLIPIQLKLLIRALIPKQ